MSFPLPDRRDLLRWLIGAFYIVAGIFHLAQPDPFVRITPDWVPVDKYLVVYATGFAELVGAGFIVNGLRANQRFGALALALYALCVWPANVNHMLMDMARADGGWGMAYHLPRMIAQPLLIWATLWSARLIDWPFASNGKPG